jgi:PadR family transcriptional regulator AphA
MPDLRLSPTSYAILGLLAIKPWSTYEITKQMRRALLHVWPRAESNLYKEPQRLVEAGLATAERRLIGRRERTEYAITGSGRAALEAWLERPSAPTRLESEAMLKVLFGNYASTTTLQRHLADFATAAEATDVPWRAIAQEYIDGEGLFPERIHVNVLYWVLLDRWSRLRVDWARWAATEVARWRDAGGPVDRKEMLTMLERALGDEPDFLTRRGGEPG